MKFKFILSFFFILMLNTNAYAYLDPGLGSILLQGIITGIAAVSLTIKIYWHKIRDFFKKKKKKTDL